MTRRLAPSPIRRSELYTELWISLAGLLRSYAALHGLPRDRTAAIDYDEQRIRAGHGEKLLILTRNRDTITWMRENGSTGTVRLTQAGTLRAADSEQAMDLAAEDWARELMQ